MKEDLASTTRRHPAALASIVIASVAVTALAVVTIAYLLGWVPARGGLPSAPGGMAAPGQQVVGTVQQGGVDLLPGETLVAPADGPTAAPAAPKRAPLEPPGPAAAKKTPPPTYAPPPAPPSSTGYAQVLPSRAAPATPNYRRGEAPLTSFERSTRDICVNCGTIASIGSAGEDWEVRVRFEDGSTETLRYPDRPRLRIGERVHLEDGRLVPE